MNTVAGKEALVIDTASRYPGVNSYGLNPGLVKHRLVEGVIGVLFDGPPKYPKTSLLFLYHPTSNFSRAPCLINVVRRSK
jgi:hypothetical protein